MPKLTRKPPKYSHHIPTGQARVRYQGKDHYLGIHGSPESYAKYAEFIARWRDGTPPNGAEKAQKHRPSILSIAELVESYLEHCEKYYRRDGKPTGEAAVMRCALRPLWKMFGRLPLVEFGPLRLEEVRDRMVSDGWSRNYVNASVRRIRQCFNWGVSREKVPVTVADALAKLKGLREGESEARENDPIGPVEDAVVEATLPHVSGVVADLIQIMRRSGARPAEAVGMTVQDIDRTDPTCWIYSPRRHKTSHRGKRRTVRLGPQCQQVLGRRITQVGADGRIFQITVSGLQQAIKRAARRAGVGHWAPNQLRHSWAADVGTKFGIEAVRVTLDHADHDTAAIYAERDDNLGRDVARTLG
jgi:integrase